MHSTGMSAGGQGGGGSGDGALERDSLFGISGDEVKRRISGKMCVGGCARA